MLRTTENGHSIDVREVEISFDCESGNVNYLII